LGSWREVSKSLPGLAFLGIVSIGDLVKSIIGDREFVIGVGAVHAPDITHHNTNTNVAIAITLIRSRSMVASTLSAALEG
jgi:hypothetical protein